MDYNSSGQYNYNYPPAPPQPPGPPPSGEPNTNSKSITALVLGILAIAIPYIGFFIGIVAIIIAALSFKEIKITNEKGHGLSVAGMVCGIIGTVIYGLIFLFFIVVIIIAASSPDNFMNYSNF
ncbi:DUF4190 domain-containing protein [Paenibacillus bouchesdurhonensis]|uniref:DUF4190 domain-containing protein n=1 Tax=Paenibacillus bouchesdurhonensis TaxID=1870990 RepID=UPI000DA5F1D5|nr:DUF4190 domain-containing protein [Paenibacillus bouchesdurhonensis]